MRFWFFAATAMAMSSAASTSPADAASVTHTFSQTINLGTACCYGRYIALSRFDPALGTLTRVTNTVRLAFFVEATWDLTQVPVITPGVSNLPIYGEADGLFVPEFDTLQTVVSFRRETLVVPNSNGTAGRWSETYDETKTAIDLGADDRFGFAPFVGPGTLDYRVDGGFWLYPEVLTGHPISYTTSGTLTYDIALTYEYVAAGVPEPSSWAVMVLGVGLMGTAVRHRRTVRVSPFVG